MIKKAIAKAINRSISNRNFYLILGSVLLLYIVLFTQKSQAADCTASITPFISPFTLNNVSTLEQATAHIDQVLRSEDAKVFAEGEPSTEQFESINCYLSAVSSSFPEIEASRIELGRLTAKLLSNDIVDSNASVANQSEIRAAIDDINQAVNRDAGTGFVQFPAAGRSSLELDLYADILSPACSDLAQASCTSAADMATNLWWIAGYFRGLSTHYNQQDIASSQSYNQRLNRQWQSYKDDTILLWPQEVLLNSLVFKQESAGFSKPPNYKLLALRPSLGISYLSDTDHRIQPTLNIDLFGSYWWKYGRSNGATAGAGRGIAATVILDGSDAAFGISYYHNPKWSATIAHGDKNDLVISISFQLASWLLRN